MYRSLKQHCPAAQLWVLCLSDECYHVLEELSWPDIIPIKLEDFEQGDSELLAAKANRSQIEYYFTCTPSLPLFVLNHNPAIDLITYLDSDLFFFNDPEPIFQEMQNHSIAIIKHRFPEQHRWMEQNGIFNVGWLTFRRDNEGLACLSWWRERCLEWCHDYIDGERFADQKYLDRFPELFASLKVVEHKGANLAAWNLGNYKLYASSNVLLVDDQPLLFYHFQGLRKIAPGVIDPCVQFYNLRVSWFMEWKLFRPYLRRLQEAQQLIVTAMGHTELLMGLQRGRSEDNVDITQLIDRPASTNIEKLLSAYRGVLARRFLLSFN
ncbi:MAG TPA: glycosyl transferase [Blastocatellia bacterium]|nr:glycosyl transferase [Blastocatellia bacterium]